MIYLFPTEMEAKPFRQACPEAEVVICGVGMAAAAATLSNIAIDVKARNEEVLLAGIAGCYDNDASKSEIGEVVEVVSEIIGELPEKFAVRYEVEPRWGVESSEWGSELSERGVGTLEREVELSKWEVGASKREVKLSKVNSNTVSKSNRPNSETQIENMEGAVIFALCQAHKIPVSQIRAISNHVADPFPEWKIEEAIEALTQTLISIHNSQLDI